MKLFIFLCISNVYAATFVGKLPDQGYARIEIDPYVLRWTVVINYIPNVRATHIHCDSKEIGLTFLPSLTTGSAIMPDINNKCGWKTIADIQKAFEKKEAYVDVHTITEAVF